MNRISRNLALAIGLVLPAAGTIIGCTDPSGPSGGGAPIQSPIVFEAIDESAGPSAIKNGLYTMLPDGSGLHELWSETKSGYSTFTIAWAPDRKRIAFVKPSAAQEVDLVDIGTGDIKVIVPATSFLGTFLRWHPDNRHLAVLSCGGLCGSLVDVETGTSEQLTIGFEGGFDWNKDASFIAFVVPDQAAVNQVNVVRPDGSGRRTLTDGTESAFSTRWSPDGSKILFRTRESVWVVPLVGDTARRLAPASGIIPDFYRTPVTWSPDGRHIAFTRLGQLAIAGADGTEQHLVPTPGWVPWLDW